MSKQEYLGILKIDFLENPLQVFHVIVLEIVNTAARNCHAFLNGEIDLLISMQIKKAAENTPYATIMSPRLLKAGMTLPRAAKPCA